MQRTKPGPWNWSRGAVEHDWAWFARHVHILMPFWKGDPLAPHEIARRMVPTATDGNPTMQIGPYGNVIRADTGDRLRYAGATFNDFVHDAKFTAGCVFKSNTFSDDNTLFAQTTEQFTSSGRRFFIRTERSATAGDITVRDGDLDFIDGANTSLGVTYSLVIANAASSATSGLTLWVYDMDARAFVTSIDGLKNTATAWTVTNGADDQELQLLAHFKANNDDSEMDLALFYKLDGIEVNAAQARQLCEDPFGMLRRRRPVIAKAPAAAGGSILPQMIQQGLYAGSAA